MLYRIGADAVVIFHFCFVAFVVTGGLIVLRWRRVMWAAPARGRVGGVRRVLPPLCPLTPLENHLRELGGASAYQGGFVDHYIMPVLYPEGLTERTQVVLGSLILAINVICYAAVVYRWRASRRRPPRRRRQRCRCIPTKSMPPPEPATRAG